MYKMILCQRYLRTRYIALASIISVTLGVATMIVVNAVMAGFGSEMRSRIQGILSDIIIETRSTDGEFDPEAKIALVRKLVGKYIVGVTPTVEVHAVLSYRYGGDYIPHPVMLIGINPETKSEVGPFKDYLSSYQTRTENGQVIAAERVREEPVTWELTPEVLAKRIETATREKQLREQMKLQRDSDEVADEKLNASEDDANDIMNIGHNKSDETEVPIGELMPARIFVGVGMATFNQIDPETQQLRTHAMIEPGVDVKIMTYQAGKPAPVSMNATVVDTFRTGMSDYDSNLVYCNIEALQRVRKMIHENSDGSQVGAFTQLQIKLKDYKDAPKVVEILRANFAADRYLVKTWEQRQQPLLAAVDVESSILNILLFLIITVAGFGILAIFFMIVVEKTRDIGILKALGASSSGVMSIFLSYGLLLGIVGAGAGVGAGLLFVYYINQIESFISFVTGREVFPEKIYYFKDIPTHVEPFTVFWVSAGAIMIAVLASVFPARRAARLRPVQALRYE